MGKNTEKENLGFFAKAYFCIWKYTGNQTAALFLDRVQYWVEINSQKKQSEKYFHDGRWWMFNTHKEWVKDFGDAISERTIRRVVEILTEKNLLICGNYNNRTGDNTVWYSLNYDEINRLWDNVPYKTPPAPSGEKLWSEQEVPSIKNSTTIENSLYPIETQNKTPSIMDLSHPSAKLTIGTGQIGHAPTAKMTSGTGQIDHSVTIEYLQRDPPKNTAKIVIGYHGDASITACQKDNNSVENNNGICVDTENPHKLNAIGKMFLGLNSDQERKPEPDSTPKYYGNYDPEKLRSGIRKVCLKNKLIDHVSLCEAVILDFYEQWQEKFKREPKHLTEETISEIVQKIIAGPISEDGEVIDSTISLDAWKCMAANYLMADFADCDYSISHFLSDGVLRTRYREYNGDDNIAYDSDKLTIGIYNACSAQKISDRAEFCTDVICYFADEYYHEYQCPLPAMSANTLQKVVWKISTGVVYDTIDGEEIELSEITAFDDWVTMIHAYITKPGLRGNRSIAHFIQDGILKNLYYENLYIAEKKADLA